jgi:hypothetical protein
MSLRKLGSFIKIKNNGIQPFKIRKSNAKSMDRYGDEFVLFQSHMEAKEFEKQ